MKDFCIYLAGGMSGLSLEEQTKWRLQVQKSIKHGGYDVKKNVAFIDPTQYYSVFDEHTRDSQREAMEFDIYHLKRSDMVVVNFNAPNSIGSAMELMLAKEHGIPIIGLNKDGHVLHPWIEICTNKMFNDIRDLVEYIVNFYLN